jgi:hypothetical protein
METTTYKVEQNQALQQPTGIYDQEVGTSRPSLSPNGRCCRNFRQNLELQEPTRTYDLFPDQARDSTEDIVGTFGPYQNIQPQGRNFLDSSEKTPAGKLQTFDRWISQTTWSFETKLWGYDEHPKERLCPKNYGLKLPTTPGIANLGQEHQELGFIRKSTNRRPNPVFEGSRSSTKRHKALTHDPLKEI